MSKNELRSSGERRRRGFANGACELQQSVHRKLQRERHLHTPLRADRCRDLLQSRQACIKKHPIGLAEVIFSRSASRLLPVPPAAAPADHEIRTGAAFFCMIAGSFHKSLL